LVKKIKGSCAECGDEENWADEDSADGVYDYGCVFVFHSGWFVFYWDSV